MENNSWIFNIFFLTSNNFYTTLCSVKSVVLLKTVQTILQTPSRTINIVWIFWKLETFQTFHKIFFLIFDHFSSNLMMWKTFIHTNNFQNVLILSTVIAFTIINHLKLETTSWISWSTCSRLFQLLLETI